MERKNDIHFPNKYGFIDRGCSVSIPVRIQNVDATPIDLTGYQVCFTVKKVPMDHDQMDELAFIKKDFLPQNPIQGSFIIELSAQDTNIEPGEYFFDIVLISAEKDAWRAIQMTFEIVGGVSNRQVPYSTGVKVNGNPITLIVAPKKPVIITTPTGPSI